MSSTPDRPDAAPEGAAESGAPVEEPGAPVEEPVEVVDPDPALLEAHDLALAALREITPEATIGEPAGYRVERDGVVSLRFSNRMAGYPGWYWTVSLARVEGAEPTVLEAELLPGDGALLAPDWVPWAVRLAEYHAAQAAAAEAAHAEDEVDVDEDLDDVDDLDVADFDDDGSPILHAGDLDGVDIDELADETPPDADLDEFDSDEDDFHRDEDEDDSDGPFDDEVDADAGSRED